VDYGGKVHSIGQANNVFIFPGVGLGTIVSAAHEVTDAMFLVAAQALADMVSDGRLAQGALYPTASDLRKVSRYVAIRVVCEARNSGIGREYHDEEVEAVVDAEMWYPDYRSYIPVICESDQVSSRTKIIGGISREFPMARLWRRHDR
jgi:malic enzyme